jgi:hypothetical protein
MTTKQNENLFATAYCLGVVCNPYPQLCAIALDGKSARIAAKKGKHDTYNPYSTGGFFEGSAIIVDETHRTFDEAVKIARRVPQQFGGDVRAVVEMAKDAIRTSDAGV